MECLNQSAPVSTNHTPTPNALTHFSIWYAHQHGFSSVIVCTFGIITNAFNISVLTRKEMTSQTNVLLTWLAVSDLLTMVSYIPFAWHFYIAAGEPPEERFSYAWMMYLLVHVSFSVVTHNVSIWLGVSLAVLRFITLTSVKRGAHEQLRRIRVSKVIVVVVILLSVLITVPNFFINVLKAHLICGELTNITIYELQGLKLGTANVSTLELVSVITYGTFAKLLPCVLMCVFGGALLYNVGVKGGDRRKRLTRLPSSSSVRRHAGQNRTTRMLITVLVLFLITELPQALLIFLSVGVSGFYEQIYSPLGDLMDFIALVNNAVNFVLYCSMSQQFRERFLAMYCKSNHTLKLTTSSIRTSIHQPQSQSNITPSQYSPNGSYLHVNYDRRDTLTTTFPRTCTTELLSAVAEEQKQGVNSCLLSVRL